LDLEVLKELGEADKIGEPKPLEVKGEEEEANQPTTISSNGFYGSKVEGAQAQPASRAQPMRASVAASAHATIYPIEAISPYSNKWTMKARCTSKSSIKTWHNKNGEGKLFSVNLLDDSGEIRATGFNDQCDALYDLFQEGSVYYISSPCRVQIAKKQFTNLNNDYELTFEKDTLVEKVNEASSLLILMQYLPTIFFILCLTLESCIRQRNKTTYHKSGSTSRLLLICRPSKKTRLLMSLACSKMSEKHLKLCQRALANHTTSVNLR
jgi:hypothetical protein